MAGEPILVTGSSGFIGSFLVEEALARNYSVHAAIRSSSRTTWLRSPAIHTIGMDLSDRAGLENFFRRFREKHGRFRYIIHNAGVTKAPKTKDFFRVNCDYTRNLTDALVSADAVPEKFIFISSLAAFGPAQGEGRISDDQQPQPVSCYGQSKIAAEQYLAALPRFPYLVLRPAAVYGPRDREFYFLYRLINRGIIPYIGSRDQQLSFIHVSDLARAVLDAAESGFVKRSWFISDGHDYTVETFNETVRKHLDRKAVNIVFPASVIKPLAWILEKLAAATGSVSTFNRERVKEFEARSWLCNSDSLHEDLRFVPSHNLDTGMKESLRWYQINGWL